MDAQLLSPGTLAFVGDAVYGLYVRKMLSNVNRPAGKLHGLSVKMVSAPAQAKAMDIIEPLLNETEEDIFKRGRNSHVNGIPKSATAVEYHRATGLEALFGYLNLNGEIDRADFLFNKIWDGFLGNIV